MTPETPPAGSRPPAGTAPGAAAAPSSDRTPIEVELKYRMTDPATGERLLAADSLAGFVPLGPAETVRHEDRYVDTADGALATAGFAGRLRETGGRAVITLKGLRRLDDGGAAHRREELEGPGRHRHPAHRLATVRGARRAGHR